MELGRDKEKSQVEESGASPKPWITLCPGRKFPPLGRLPGVLGLTCREVYGEDIQSWRRKSEKKKNNEKPVKMCLDTKLRRGLEKDQFNIIFSGADNSPFIWCSVYFRNNDF